MARWRVDIPFDAQMSPNILALWSLPSHGGGGELGLCRATVPPRRLCRLTGLPLCRVVLEIKLTMKSSSSLLHFDSWGYSSFHNIGFYTASVVLCCSALDSASLPFAL